MRACAEGAGVWQCAGCGPSSNERWGGRSEGPQVGGFRPATDLAELQSRTRSRLGAAVGNSRTSVSGRRYLPLRARWGGRPLLTGTGPSSIVLWTSDRAAKACGSQRQLPRPANWRYRPYPVSRVAPKQPDGESSFFLFRFYEAAARDLTDPATRSSSREAASRLRSCLRSEPALAYSATAKLPIHFAATASLARGVLRHALRQSGEDAQATPAGDCCSYRSLRSRCQAVGHCASSRIRPLHDDLFLDFSQAIFAKEQLVA